MKFEIKNRWTGNVQFTAEIECDENRSLSWKIRLAVLWAIENAADLRSSDLSDANLRSADLSDANLRSADLSAANLRSANLSDANLSDANLRSANLSDANLRSADLSAANLRSANLSDANLSDANLRSANLSDANLRSANLSDANLRSADLSAANLRSADLSDANLRSADLRSANLRSFKACLWMTLTTYGDEVPTLVLALNEGRVDGSKYEGECSCLIGTIANAKKVSFNELPKNSNDPSERWFLMIKKGDKPGDDSAGGFASKMVLEWIEEWQSLQPKTVS